MAAELLGVLGIVVPAAGASAGVLCAGVVVLPWLCWTTAFGPLRGRGGLVGVVPVAVGVCVEVVVGVDVVGVVAVAVGVVAVPVVVVLGVVLTGASAGALADGPPPGPVTVGA
jgi:hypothetical protein